MTWYSLGVAMNVARNEARRRGHRMRVVREDGADLHGRYRFRILPWPEVAEPCS